MSIQIHTPNLMSISRKTTEKSAENYIQTKENIWCAIRSNAIKVKLDLYMYRQIHITKSQVNITKQERKLRKTKF